MAIIFGMINFWWQTLMVTLLNSNIVAKPQKSAPCKNMESKSGGKSLFMRWHRSGQTAGCIGIVLKPLITQCPGSSSVVKNFSFDKICTLEWIGHWGQAIISQPPLYAHWAINIIVITIIAVIINAESSSTVIVIRNAYIVICHICKWLIYHIDHFFILITLIQISITRRGKSCGKAALLHQNQLETTIIIVVWQTHPLSHSFFPCAQWFWPIFLTTQQKVR